MRLDLVWEIFTSVTLTCLLCISSEFHFSPTQL